jgi:hypothetical protein
MTGIFGDLVNYFLFLQKDADIVSLPRSIVVGAAAAFLVPVVLFLVGSDLLRQSQFETSQLILLASICLIAALASRFFVLSTADQVDNMARDARARIAALEHEINSLQQRLSPIFASETEPEEGQDPNQSLPQSDDFDITTTNVLQQLNVGPQIFRSVAGICQHSALDEGAVSKALHVLRQHGLANRMMAEHGIRWHITPLGQRYLQQFH